VSNVSLLNTSKQGQAFSACLMIKRQGARFKALAVKH